MKIKTKKQLNLPQLIEWAWDNPELSRNKHFVSENKEVPYIKRHVIFNEICHAEIDNNYCYEPSDLFTVEVEEEITKDTKLPSALVYDGKYFNALYGLSINDIEKRFIDYVYGVETIHLINGDIHTLIWRNGKMVE